MKDAYSQIFRSTAAGKKDTFFWILAPFEDIRAKTLFMGNPMPKKAWTAFLEGNLPDEALEHSGTSKPISKKKPLSLPWLTWTNTALLWLIASRKSAQVLKAAKEFKLAAWCTATYEKRALKKKLDTVGTRKLSRIKGSRIPIDVAQLFKYLPSACGQFISSVVKILFNTIPQIEIGRGKNQG